MEKRIPIMPVAVLVLGAVLASTAMAERAAVSVPFG